MNFTLVRIYAQLSNQMRSSCHVIWHYDAVLMYRKGSLFYQEDQKNLSNFRFERQKERLPEEDLNVCVCLSYRMHKRQDW